MQKSELIQKLASCIEACNHCAKSCLDENDVDKMADCIKSDLDCALICNSAMQLVAMESGFSGNVLETCIKSCIECATECEKHDHEHCKACASACRECQMACQDYLLLV